MFRLVLRVHSRAASEGKTEQKVWAISQDKVCIDESRKVRKYIEIDR